MDQALARGTRHLNADAGLDSPGRRSLSRAGLRSRSPQDSTRFEKLARQIVSVPKKEIDARRAGRDNAKQPPRP
jgi:hypothetical protein